VVVFYRVGLFLATLSFMAGVAILLGSIRDGGLGIVVGPIIVLGSVSLIVGLRRRIFTPELAPHAEPAGWSTVAGGRHRR
jgi:hypothetical protein